MFLSVHTFLFELVIWSQGKINIAGCFQKEETLYNVTKYRMNM